MLPSEIRQYIFTFLEPHHLAPVFRVCWNWCKDASSDEVWLVQYKNRWKFNPQSELLFRHPPTPWKLFYRNRLLVQREYLIDDEHLTDEQVCSMFALFLTRRILKKTTINSVDNSVNCY